MAIHIDIYAHLREQQLIKEGDQILRLVDHYTDEANRRSIRGAEGRSKKLIALNDKLETSFDGTINKIDDFTIALNRQERAAQSFAAAERDMMFLFLKSEKEREAATKSHVAAQKELAAANLDLVYKGQALTKSVRDETRARSDLNDESALYTKNAKAVTRLVNSNRKEFTQLSRTTNKLRRETENLHSANLSILRDNKAVARSMDGMSKATEKTSRAREKYNEIRKKDGVSASEIKAQGRVLKDALEAEARQAQDLSAQIVEVVRHRRNHDTVINQNAASLRDLAQDTIDANMRVQQFRASNESLINQNATLSRQFDRVGDTTEKVVREYRKFNEMSRDGSVSSAALAVQVEKVNAAYKDQQKAVRDSSAALDEYYRRQDEAEKRAAAAAYQQMQRDKRRIMPQSAGQYIARNLGALTPLGTLSPSVLLPVAGIIGTIGEAVVTASQALALLPAAGVAAAAGIGTLVVGMRGFGDALSGMGDPKKFAEALYTLSPNAQQAALRIKELVDGPLGDLKRATQDALFADVGVTIQRLTQALGPAIQRMTTSIATSFNQMFTGISYQMMTPDMSARFTAITTNISEMFDRLTPGISALNSAFMKLAETGSGFLPQLADGFSNLMITFDRFITRAQEDGSLQNFMQKGIDAVAAISKWLLQFGQDIYKVFGNKSPEEFMNMLNTLKDVAVGLIEVFRGVAGVMDTLAPIIKEVVDFFGGWENVMWGIVSGGVLVGLYKFVKWGKEFLTVFGLIGPAGAAAARGVGAVGAAAAITSGAAGAAGGAAAAAAAAKPGAAATAGAFAAAGAGAGAGFLSKFKGALRGGIGPTIGFALAAPILDGLDRAFNEWIASKGDNPKAYMNEYDRQQEENIFPEWVPILPFWEDLFRGRFGGDSPQAPPPDVGELGALGQPFTEVPDPDLGLPTWLDDLLNGGPPADLPLPNTPIDPETGKALTDSEWLNKVRGELPRESYAVDPFVDPITGQKLNPMLPIGPNGMPEYPAGGVPGTPSIQGPVMPQYNSFGQMTGYGANMVDPEAVFDAQLGVIDRGRDLEEANKDLLAAQKAGILSAEEINDLERRVIDGKLSLHKALVQLGKAQTGDVEKLKNSTNDAKNALGEFGLEIDKDFGISKGLGGIAENITKFIASLAFAPAFGAMRGAQAALGFPGGEGTGYGLAGAAAVSRGYYKGGPMDPNAQQGVPQQGSGYAPSAYTASYSQPVGPQSEGVGYGTGPANVKRSDIKGINLSTIPVAAQQYANNCIDAAAQIILSANGVQLTQDQIEQTIKRGGSIDSLASGLNKLDPTGGYVPIPASGGSPEALLSSVQDSINKGNGSVLNVAPGSSIAGQNFPYGHFIAVTGYDPTTGRINLSDTAKGTMYSVTPGEAFQASKGRGLVAGRGVAQGPGARPQPTPGPILGPYPVTLPKFATGGEVPIMAHSGEHVLTREDVAALGGQSGVYNFRRSLHSYEVGGAIPRTPFSPDPFDPSNNVGIPIPARPTSPKDVTNPTDLGSLLGVGDNAPQSAPPPPAPPVPPVAPTPPPGPLAAEAPAVSVPAVLPETVLPPGVQTPGAVIGAQVEAPEGYGGGFEFTGGGLAGLAAQGLMMAATSGAGMGAMAGGGGGGAASAIASLGMETAIKLGQRGIEYGAQVAGIATQGALETFLPAGGSELASNNWLTRIIGGVVGAAPAMANLAGGAGASNQSTLPGVGGPPTPEQIAAQGMDPNRAQHTGAGAPAGPYTGVNIQNYVVTAAEDRAGQDLARYQPAPGAR